MLRTAAVLLLIAAAAAADSLPPGKHSNLPCPESADDTWNALVPASYQPAGSEAHPVLFISGPSGNPGFMGVEGWAEREGVILVTINKSRNGPSEPIIASQKAVIAAAEARLRLHPCLRFAMGMSGAAQASWLLISMRPQQSAGLLMMGQSGFDDPFPPKHVAVAYLHGDKEGNIPFIDSLANRLASAGNPLRRKVVPGGHVSGSGQDRMELLDWMLTVARVGHPGLDEAQRKQGWAILDARLDALAAIADPSARAAAAAAFLELPPVQGRPPMLKRVVEVWRPAALAQAMAEAEGRDRTIALLRLNADPRMKASPEAGQISKSLGEAKKDAALKPEFDAWSAWQAGSAQIAAARGEGAKKKLAAQLRAIATRWPDTAGAREAEAAANRLAPAP